VLADGCADLVSMARPWLADGEIIAKAIDGREGEINTCIACNQACLDRTFKGKVAGCVVNPRAGRETEFTKAAPQGLEGRYAVVGGGPAGMSTALELAKRGATVDLYETQEKLGGQFLLAHQIPGKEEFAETLRYYQHELDRHGVRIHLGTRFEPTDVGAAQDKGDPFKAVAWCAGIRPRVPSIPGNDLPIAVPYDKVLTGEVEVGQRVALIGAGGIGFDVADFLSHPHGEETVDGFRKSWGIDGTLEHDGGLIEPQRPSNGRTLYLLQRKEGKPGKGLGKTTGWIHRLTLRFRGVQTIPGVTYKAIEPGGLRIEVGGEEQFLELDNVVFCSGQLSNNEPVDALEATGIPVTVIGGAKEAYGIDAERAIREGFEWARSL
jgi:2,4-dienoyl-CoA reductase (NADPH2)